MISFYTLFIMLEDNKNKTTSSETCCDEVCVYDLLRKVNEELSREPTECKANVVWGKERVFPSRLHYFGNFV